MPTRRAIEDALRAWAVAASGLADDHVVIAGKGAPRQAEPFMTVKIISGPTRIGSFDALVMPKNSDEAGASELVLLAGPRKLTASFSAYGEGGRDKLDAVLNAVSSVALCETYLTTRQIVTATVSGSGAAGTYAVALDGATISVVTTTAKTLDEIASLLVAKINADGPPEIPVDAVSAEKSTGSGSTGKFTITARLGVEFLAAGSSHVAVVITQESVDLAPVADRGIIDADKLLGSQFDAGVTLDIEFNSHARTVEPLEIVERVEIENIDGDDVIVGDQ